MSPIDAAYNMWRFKKWSDGSNLTLSEIDEAFDAEMADFATSKNPGPLMRDFKNFIETKGWEINKNARG